jgi:hypothetical protein
MDLAPRLSARRSKKRRGGARATKSSRLDTVVTAQGECRRCASCHLAKVERSQESIDGCPRASSESWPRSVPLRVFVAMSFREEEEPELVDYWQAMVRAAEKARRDFTLIRIDQIDGDYDVADRIYKEIDAAHLVIADLTLSPANVYLEIGYARGRGKLVIQTCRADTRLEFDVRGRRTLVYRNATALEHRLARELDAL